MPSLVTQTSCFSSSLETAGIDTAHEKLNETKAPDGLRTSSIAFNRAAGNMIVKRALHWVGRGTYSWATCDPNGTFDCSGFVSYALTGVYARIGTTYTMVHNSTLFPEVTSPEPGDIVIYQNGSDPEDGHCGIYYMHNLMIECRFSRGVIIEEFDNTYHFRRYLGNNG